MTKTDNSYEICISAMKSGDKIRIDLQTENAELKTRLEVALKDRETLSNILRDTTDLYTEFVNE